MTIAAFSIHRLFYIATLAFSLMLGIKTPVATAAVLQEKHEEKLAEPAAAPHDNAAAHDNAQSDSSHGAATPTDSHGGDAHGDNAGGEHATSGHAEGEHADGDFISHHIQDAYTLDFEPFGEIHLPRFAPVDIGGVMVDLSITRHIVFMWLACLILLVVFIVVGSSYQSLKANQAPKGLANVMESLVNFIRIDLAKANIGAGYEHFVPYLLTAFFFILVCNLLGLIPFGSSATGNINVTFTLAVFTFFITQYGSIRANGIGGWLSHLTGGTPILIWPIMIPVEFIGLFTKPFALMIRLFANMTAGHIVILSLIGLIFSMKSVGIIPVSILFSLFIYFLELAVAFIQAYIFTMLSSVFIGLATAHDHDDHDAAHAEKGAAH